MPPSWCGGENKFGAHCVSPVFLGGDKLIVWLYLLIMKPPIRWLVTLLAACLHFCITQIDEIISCRMRIHHHATRTLLLTLRLTSGIFYTDV